MQTMEDKPNSIESLLETTQEYIKTTFELFKLKALDKSSELVSAILTRAIAFFFIFMFFLMASIGLSIWLGEILGAGWYGFLIVAAFYGIIGLILSFFNGGIKKLIANSFVKQVFK